MILMSKAVTSRGVVIGKGHKRALWNARKIIYLDLGSVYICKIHWIVNLRVIYFMYSIPP